MKTYTITQLKEAWGSYKTDKVMIVLKEGKLLIRPVGTKLDGNVTSARIVTYKEAISFPLYLERFYG